MIAHKQRSFWGSLMIFKSIKGSRDPKVSLKIKTIGLGNWLVGVERENRLGSVPGTVLPMGIMSRTGFKGEMMSWLSSDCLRSALVEHTIRQRSMGTGDSCWILVYVLSTAAAIEGPERTILERRQLPREECSGWSPGKTPPTRHSEKAG